MFGLLIYYFVAAILISGPAEARPVLETSAGAISVCPERTNRPTGDANRSRASWLLPAIDKKDLVDTGRSQQLIDQLSSPSLSVAGQTKPRPSTMIADQNRQNLTLELAAPLIAQGAVSPAGLAGEALPPETPLLTPGRLAPESVSPPHLGEHGEAVIPPPVASGDGGSPTPATKPVVGTEDQIEPGYHDDCVLMANLAGKGWESSRIEAFHAVDGSMLTSDGHKAIDAGGQPSNLLLEFGCTHLISRRFKRGQRFCTATIYRFATSAGAYGAYTNLRVGASTILLRGDASSEDDDSISFWKGTRFISLATTTRGDDEAKELLTVLGNTLAQQVQEAAPKPPLLRQLPVLEKIGGSERYYLGPIAARTHLALPYINLLSLSRCHGALSADYQYPQPFSERLRLLIVNYEKASLATSVFSAYTASLQFGSKLVEDSDHHLLCKVNDSYLMCTLSGNQISIIWGARKKYAPSMLARQLGRLDTTTLE